MPLIEPQRAPVPGPDSAAQLTKDVLRVRLPHCKFMEVKAVPVIESYSEIESKQTNERERRAKRRFQIEQDVRYKMLYGQRIAETGSGKTLNISSSGVWFTTETMLTIGMPVELSMTWPVLLNDSCPMKLMIYGCVVRSNERGAAVAIERYEFRTQGRTFQQQAQHPGIPAGVELRIG